MSWLLEAFEPSFMQRALIAGLLAVTATSLVGTWVVVRGLSFLGDALAHGVIPGIAVAVLTGFNPVLGALIAALAMTGLITVITTRTSFPEDTSIGLLFVGMLSLGIVIVSKSGSFATDVTSLLFGEVLGVTRGDLQTQALAVALVTIVTIVMYRPFLALAFNRQKAATLGMRPALAHAALLAILAVSIVASFQAIGTLLVFGLIVGPPATASLIVHRIPAIMAGSMIVGAFSVVSGLLVSFHYGTAGGATISGLAVAYFFVALTIRELVSAVRPVDRGLSSQ
ncbi:MAG: zinc ABC transporter permease AztB [Acidimicrobiia bacterium]|nr:zinc ABC transporter permease AztB [Acidimicrobiia bacterium]